MSSWDSLSMRERADVMKLFIDKGVYNLDTIRREYNLFDEGGKTSSNPWIMKDEPRESAERDRLLASGGYLYDYYDDGGWLDGLKKAVKSFLFRSSNPTVQKKDKKILYRDKPAEIVGGKAVPKRVQRNNSPTQQESEKWENSMRSYLVSRQAKTGSSNPEYDIPFIPEKAILINGSTTSTNVLDSLAKYAGMHNRTPRLSQNPIMRKDRYSAPRRVNKNEMLGLAAQETHVGALPYYNMNGDKKHDRALGNANYFTAFGHIPAENIVRNFHYNDAKVDRSTPPLLDAFQYYAQGDYNRGNRTHTKDVNATGKEVWNNPAVKKWWELSGKYWYNDGKGPK